MEDVDNLDEKGMSTPITSSSDFEASHSLIFHLAQPHLSFLTKEAWEMQSLKQGKPRRADLSSYITF